MYLEIRDQDHLMLAEGSSERKPVENEIVKAILKRGFVASHIDIFYDDMLCDWCFTADIIRGD